MQLGACIEKPLRTQQLKPFRFVLFNVNAVLVVYDTTPSFLRWIVLMY